MTKFNLKTRLTYIAHTPEGKAVTQSFAHVDAHASEAQLKQVQDALNRVTAVAFAEARITESYDVFI